MVPYRFYYLDGRDHIIDAEWAACIGDAAAMARAAAKLLARREPRHRNLAGQAPRRRRGQTRGRQAVSA